MKKLLFLLLLAPVLGLGQGEQRYADGTATDQDGNTFEWINYGTQDWAIENAEVVTYRDGTPIPQVTDGIAWENLTTGAWSYYNNNPTKPRLYNWYAVAGIHDNDPNTPNKEFAPEGWHVPSDAEWTTLENYLIANGYNYDGTTTGNKIAKAMASTTGWNNRWATGEIGTEQSLNNYSGFNAFPEGYHYSNGSFFEGTNAKFWSSSGSSADNAWDRNLSYGSSNLIRYSGSDKRIGFSVRFVRDATSCLVAINPDTENQSVCEGNLITPIEYSISNDVSGINLTWTKDGASIIGNPPGIGYSINTGQLVFEGNPSENITTTTTYSYNIQTTGGLCGGFNANGTIVVHPIPRIQLAATTFGSLSQIRCEGDDIDDIVINLLDGASSPGVTGFPAGLSYFYDSVANTLTISGTLDASNPNDNYNYTVIASGSSVGCTASLSGVLTISREDVLTPMSEISQSVCEGNQITPISFNYSGGAIGVTLQWSVNGSVINLPSGLVVDNQEGNLTISGTLENFNSGDEISYSVTTNNSGCTPAKSYSGIITIVPTEQCVEPGKIILNGPVEVNDGTFYIKKEDGLILYSSFDDQCYRIKVHTGQVIAEPINCD